MNNFCLGNIVNVNNLLTFGLDNQVQMLLELAQLAQLQSLGFLNVLGAQNLIQSNLLLGNQLNAFNVGGYPKLFPSFECFSRTEFTFAGVLKREVARIKPTLKRTVARRGLAAARSQCNLASVVTVQNLPLCADENDDDNVDNNDGENDNNNDDNNENDDNVCTQDLIF